MAVRSLRRPAGYRPLPPQLSLELALLDPDLPEQEWEAAARRAVQRNLQPLRRRQGCLPWQEYDSRVWRIIREVLTGN